MPPDPTHRLVAVIEWTRDKLERLHRATDDEFVRGALHAIIRSCDPETNPRLRAAIEDAERSSQ